MKRKDEKENMEEMHQRKVEKMIKSAEVNAGQTYLKETSRFSGFSKLPTKSTFTMTWAHFSK